MSAFALYCCVFRVLRETSSCPRHTRPRSVRGAGGRRWARAVAVGALTSLVASCQLGGSRGNESAPASTGPRPSPALDLRGEHPWPPSLTDSLLWRRAVAGDDIDQARLARRQGAAGLLSALGHGGQVARTALAALAYADDRRSARGRLCELLAGTDPTTRELLLVALHDAVASTTPNAENLSAKDDATCRQRLGEIERATDSSASVRDRAQGALVALGPP